MRCAKSGPNTLLQLLVGFSLLCLVLSCIFVSSPVRAAEEARLMERWLVSDSLSTRVVDHSTFGAFLETYLKDGGFDYGAVTPEDKAVLADYLQMLSRTDVDRLNRNEQVAFWINAYNALALSAVLSEYPVRSINDVGGSFFSPGPWDEKIFRVYLIDLSLNDIYHRILRPIWQDNRIHYALNCLGRGCPMIRAMPYNGASVDETLEAAARDFINDGEAILLLQEDSVRLSRIYDWYEEDFGDGEEAIIDHLRSFANPDLARALEGVTEISGHGFDWSLNDSGAGE